MIEILNRYNNAHILWKSPCSTMREAVLEAIAKKTDLRDADLRDANLRDADLRYANLRYVNLRYADLRYADLRYANLSDADLRDADLRYANLRYANLRYADLRYADLSDADLRDADLRYADLRYANLRYANLRYANLRYADLRYANLRYANLRYANLSDANLRDANNAELAIAMTRILPQGDIVAYKKARCVTTSKDVVVQLLIPALAKRSHAFGRKCRAEFAIVTAIDGTEEAFSIYDHAFRYKVGDTLKPKEQFDENWQEECSSGIHFFITASEAAAYSL